SQTWELGVGIDDLPSSSGFAIAPNPASDLLAITLNAPASDNTSIQVNDAQGRLVLMATVRAGAQRTELDLAALASGTYQVNLRGEHDIATRRLVVAR
nr:T9SS type A sorting domain-containing protein [Flavobacteriales bacterium]